MTSLAAPGGTSGLTKLLTFISSEQSSTSSDQILKDLAGLEAMLMVTVARTNKSSGPLGKVVETLSCR